MIGLEELLHWRPLASALWLVVLLAWETWRPCFQLFREPRERGLHAVRNIAMAVLNVILISLVFASAWSFVANWSTIHHVGFLRWLPLVPRLHALLAFLLLDGWTYAWHRISHRVPFLWRFHRVHHSDRYMDVTTANRFHVGEILLSSLLRIPLIALLGIEFGELVLYETLLQVCVQWQHANIRLSESWERRLGWVLITPGIHKVHHSNHQIETDSNYASLLSIWDRWFGTRRRRDDIAAIAFGIEGEIDTQPETLAGMLRRPMEPLRAGGPGPRITALLRPP